MDTEEKTQPTDAANQAKDEFDNIDFGDEQPPEKPKEEPPAEVPDEKQTSKDKSESFINQDAVNKRINEITFQKYEEKRKREELEAELNQLKSKIEKENEKPGDIQIPPLPDIYDDDYESKIQAREAALQKAVESKVRKALMQEQEQKSIKAELEKQQAKIAQQVTDMFESGKKLGITEEELRKADMTVSGFIKDPNIARFILSRKDAALIVKYLSSSAIELEKLGSMDPLEASVYIATNVSSQAEKLKPGVTKTPDPIDIPSGKAAPNEDPYLKGVSFE